MGKIKHLSNQLNLVQYLKHDIFNSSEASIVNFYKLKVLRKHSPKKKRNFSINRKQRYKKLAFLRCNQTQVKLSKEQKAVGFVAELDDCSKK